MARTAVTPTVLGPNAATDEGAGETIDAALVTAGVSITGVPLEELILQVTHTAAAAHDVTVAAGDSPPQSPSCRRPDHPPPFSGRPPAAGRASPAPPPIRARPPRA